jgi:hypothetical protein
MEFSPLPQWHHIILYSMGELFCVFARKKCCALRPKKKKKKLSRTVHTRAADGGSLGVLRERVEAGPCGSREGDIVTGIQSHRNRHLFNWPPLHDLADSFAFSSLIFFVDTVSAPFFSWLWRRHQIRSNEVRV